MKDLTQGSITKHLLSLSIFIALSMAFQTTYYLVDLYFVGHLGSAAIAAVALAGNLMLVVLAITQALSVGTTTLVSHAVGRKDHARASLVFNQAFVLSCVVGVAFGITAFATRGLYCGFLAADPDTAGLGVEYLNWFVPAMTLQFLIVSMAAALRGSGVMLPTMVIQILSVLVNMVLAPILILGWGTGRPFGVAGAAMATFVAVIAGVVMFWAYFLMPGNYLKVTPSEWRPRGPILWGMSKVGMPAGGEFALMTVYMVLVYWIIRPFGAAAQAGFGIGGRLMQSMFLPTMAFAFAAAPLAGQNFGARNAARVRETFRAAIGMVSAIMIVATVLSHLAPEAMIGLFSQDPAVIAFGAGFLRIISFNFLAVGVVFTCSSMFQGMGHTLPPLLCSSLRILLFALPAYLLSLRPAFEIRQVWFLSVVTVALQAMLSYYLVRREFRRRLDFGEASLPVAAA
jgi:putative MATE family efflux protein